MSLITPTASTILSSPLLTPLLICLSLHSSHFISILSYPHVIPPHLSIPHAYLYTPHLTCLSSPILFSHHLSPSTPLVSFPPLSSPPLCFCHPLLFSPHLFTLLPFPPPLSSPSLSFFSPFLHSPHLSSPPSLLIPFPLLISPLYTSRLPSFLHLSSALLIPSPLTLLFSRYLCSLLSSPHFFSPLDSSPLLPSVFYLLSPLLSFFFLLQPTRPPPLFVARFTISCSYSSHYGLFSFVYFRDSLAFQILS